MKNIHFTQRVTFFYSNLPTIQRFRQKKISSTYITYLINDLVT